MSGLSVLLVVGSALLLGLLFLLVLRGLGFGWGVALGAIIRPTDAAATSIITRTSAWSPSDTVIHVDSCRIRTPHEP